MTMNEPKIGVVLLLKNISLSLKGYMTNARTALSIYMHTQAGQRPRVQLRLATAPARSGLGLLYVITYVLAWSCSCCQYFLLYFKFVHYTDWRTNRGTGLTIQTQMTSLQCNAAAACTDGVIG